MSAPGALAVLAAGSVSAVFSGFLLQPAMLRVSAHRLSAAYLESVVNGGSWGYLINPKQFTCQPEDKVVYMSLFINLCFWPVEPSALNPDLIVLG
jgi:hypothetical protein